MKKRKKHSKDQMYRLIKEWEKSGITQEEFLKSKNIARSTFAYWIKKYRAEQTNKSVNDFIPVKIGSLENRPSPKATENSKIELTYPNGIKLTCSSQIDFSKLKELILL